jgi:hypothetical protein
MNKKLPLYIPGVDKDEEEWEEFRNLGVELGIPIPEVHLKIDLQNPGEETQTVCNRRSRSFVRNFYNCMYFPYAFSGQGSLPLVSPAKIYGSDGLALKDIGGVVADVAANVSFQFSSGDILSWTNTLNDRTRGIVVGTSNSPETFEDFRLGAIDESMSYVGQVLLPPVWDRTTQTWSTVTSRVFNNNTGSTVTIRETGIYADVVTYQTVIFSSITNVSPTAMLLRDVLSAEINILNGGQLTTSYTWSMVFPEEAVYDYTLNNIAFSLLGPASLIESTTPTTGNNNTGFWELSVPWNVNFNGDIDDKIYVGTKGVISIVEGTTGANNTSLFSIRRSQICVNPNTFYSVQRIYYGIEGTIPNRRYRVRVEGTNSTFGTLGNPNMISEYVFYENNNTRIDVHVGRQDVSFGGGIIQQAGGLQFVPGFTTITANTGYSIVGTEI